MVSMVRTESLYDGHCGTTDPARLAKIEYDRLSNLYAYRPGFLPGREKPSPPGEKLTALVAVELYIDPIRIGELDGLRSMPSVALGHPVRARDLRNLCSHLTADFRTRPGSRSCRN
jgi:hypothetical protein